MEQVRQREENTGQQLDRGVARRDGGAAGAATPPEDSPADDRNVVVRPYRSVARGAMRGGEGNRLFARDAVDDDVQKTANDGPEDADGCGNKVRRQPRQPVLCHESL